MTSIAKRPAGYLVQFILDKGRKSISFNSTYTRSEVEEFVRYLDKCISAVKRDTVPDNRTLAWLENLPNNLREKLERVGLIEIEKRIQVREIVDKYVCSAEYTHLKYSSQRCKKYSLKRLLEFYAETNVDEINRQSAIAFSDYLSTVLRSTASKASVMRDVKRLFNWAVSTELIKENPFATVKGASFRNKSREQFVSIEDYEKVMDSCNTQEERVLLTLYRIGGLRKGEAFRLHWSDVDFENDRLLIHSPKTEHIKDKDSRLIPLFPRIKEELLKLERGRETDLIISTKEASITLKMMRAIRRADLEQWTRLFQNLRSSRAIEIYRKYGAIAEREWIGHTEQTALEHYLHILDEDFQRAIEEN